MSNLTSDAAKHGKAFQYYRTWQPFTFMFWVITVQNTRVIQRPRSASRSRPGSNRSDVASVRGVPQRYYSQPTRQSTNVRVPRKTIVSGKVVNNGQENLRKTWLPDQETIKKREDQELEGAYEDDEDLTVQESLSLTWNNKLLQFQNIKRNLEIQQKTIMEVYAALRKSHEQLAAKGRKVHLPSVEELQIMNIAKMTPDQILKLCSTTSSRVAEDNGAPTDAINVDINKLYQMPTKLIETCENTLAKRKEIIDWFQSLKSEEKGIRISVLTKKISEFNSENETLKNSLSTAKAEFLKELYQIVDCFRKAINETVALQLRLEELLYEVSELNAQNVDLKKQLQAAEHLKSNSNRHKVEELEKELKEERCRKIIIKDRLTRAEGQLRLSNERAAQLEATLELVRSQACSLERTVQQLDEQKQKLQLDFDKELTTLMESIKSNTANLEEIAEAREKLQSQKEDLEKRLLELSESYDKSQKALEEKLKETTEELNEAEKALVEEKEEKKELNSIIESLKGDIQLNEQRYKDVEKQLQEKINETEQIAVLQSELEKVKRDLNAAKLEHENDQSRINTQNKTIQQIENNFKELITIEANLQKNIKCKEKYIAELEKNRSLLEQQLHDSNHKMEKYIQQTQNLERQIAEVHEALGEFENINQLKEMRDNLLETTHQNGKLADALQLKDMELEARMQHVTELEHMLEQRDNVLKMLTEKEEEQANIIKLLRNNLEMRVKADQDLTQQLSEKNAEIESLTSNVKTRKQQISQLEKIILTLEDQLHKVHMQRRKDEEKMSLLEKAMAEYETIPIDIKQSKVVARIDDLDKFIKVLENELDTSGDENHYKDLKRAKETRKREQFAEATDYNYMPPSKPRNFLDERSRQDYDNLDRKEAITKIETFKWLPNPEPLEMHTPFEEKYLQPMPKVFQANKKQRDEKKSKMLKLAGHVLGGRKGI